MIHQIFTVFDHKAESYLTPFFSPTKGLAIRNFTECVNDHEHMFGRYPADYTLFEMGTFDDQKCNFDLMPAPSVLGVGVEFKNPSTQDRVPSPLVDLKEHLK